VSTQINVAVDSGGLREQAKQLQSAARQAQLEKERTARIEQDATALLAQKQASGAASQSAASQSASSFSRYGPSFKPVLPQEEPAAQRVSSGTVAGVEWRITFSPLNTTAMDSIDQTETMTLTVGPPGQAVTASATMPNSRRQARVPYYYDLLINRDRLLLLPLGKHAGIFVYHRNFLRSIDFGNIGGTKEAFSDHGTYAFFVSQTTAKQLSVPSALSANLEDIFPQVTVNWSREQILIQAPDGTIIQSVTVDDFNQLLWAEGSRYGLPIAWNTNDPIRRATVLALQYGILNVDAANSFNFYREYLTYFSPAVYTFIQGPMTLDLNALEYEHMRSTYFSRAPRHFLRRCVLEGTCTDAKTGFDLTRTQPESLDTAVPDADFRRAKQYDVPFNGYESVGSWPIDNFSVRYPGLALGWDWDDPAYCRQQALALGFSAADLTP
jgi:hypothetical protein